MKTFERNLSSLFTQFGLANNKSEIERFISMHQGLEVSIRLEVASFWSQSQQQLLQEALQEDSDWAEVVDQLDNLLRR